MAGIGRTAGFTLFELVLVVALVATFAAVALEKLMRYQEQGEKVAMEQTVSVLRSALVLRFAGQVASGMGIDTAGIAEENPMDWLARQPDGYIGALYDPPYDEVPKGSWYFDRKTSELAYRPRLTRFFIPGPEGRELIRFRAVARVVLDDKFLPGQRVLSELTVRPVSPYRWEPDFD